MKYLLILLMIGSVSAQTFPNRPASSIQVPQLSWTKPDTRENGDALLVSEIGGYEIYLFNTASPNGSEQLFNVDGGATESYTFNGLAVGSYSVAIATYDTDGLYSDKTPFVDFSVVEKSAPKPPSFFDVIVNFIVAVLDWFHGNSLRIG